MKSTTTNSVNIEERQGKNHFLMSFHRLWIRDEIAELVPHRARNFAFDDCTHRCAFGRIEKKTGWSDEFERIPFDRIVTRCNRESTRGVMMLDGELNRWSRRHSHVDDVAAHRLQRTQHHSMKHWPRDSTVAANDN